MITLTETYFIRLQGICHLYVSDNYIWLNRENNVIVIFHKYFIVW